MNNKRLIIIFAVLLAVVAVVWFTDQHRGDSTFDGTLIELDSAAINKIIVKTPASAEVVLLREGDLWMVESGDKHYKADSSVVASLLTRFVNSKASQLVTRDPQQWKEYELTDSLASMITFYESGDKAASLYVGKVSYSRGQSSNPYGGGFNVTTYVRANDDESVYAVPDFLKAMLLAKADDYRNKKLTQVEASKIEKLEFSYPGDSSFTLEKINGKWTLGGEPADSARVAQYVAGFAWLSGQKFLNDFDPSVSSDTRYALAILTTDGKTIQITARSSGTGDGWAVQSSLNEKESWFDGSEGGLVERVFKARSEFK